MENVELDETQTRIKIAGRNINNLRYTDDTTLVAEREEELTSLLMKVKEESEKPGLELKIQKMKTMASSKALPLVPPFCVRGITAVVEIPPQQYQCCSYALPKCSSG